MLLYVLYKSSIDIEPISSTLHGVNTRFIHHPSNVENYLIGHKSETSQPPPKKVRQIHIFIHLSADFGSKFKIPIATEIVST